MPHSGPASGYKQPDRFLSYGVPDAAAINQGAPVALDQSKTSGATAAFDGSTIGDEDAIASYLAAVTNANMIGYRGIVHDSNANQGQAKRIVVGGKCVVRVRNSSGASATYPVGTAIILSPGNDYFEFNYQAVSAGATVTPINAGGVIRGFLTKAVTIANATTTLVHAWLYHEAPPEPFTFAYTLAGTNTTTLTVPLGIMRGPFVITRAGLGLETLLSQTGKVTLDVFVNGTSIWTTKPVLDSQGSPVNGVHTLKNTAAADVGTAGVYGTLDATKVNGGKNDKLSATATYAASGGAAGGLAGLTLQVDGFYF